MPASSASTDAGKRPPAQRLLAALILTTAVTACTSTPMRTTPAESTQLTASAVPPAEAPGHEGEPHSGRGPSSRNPTPPTDPPPPESADATSTLRHLVGLAEQEAEAHARESGLTWRVISRDGQDYPATMDYSTQRVNVTIENGIVTRATIG